MEFSIFIPVMVAAIQSAGQVLTSFASKAKETASKFVFDKEFFEDTIVESSEQLAGLISIASLNLKQEMREQSILDVVQELQANVASLGELLSLARTSEISSEMAEKLISSALVPLKTSIKKAELRLSQYQKDDMRLFCHVVGTNTLIAGYAYLGQSVPTLKKDLEESIYSFQKRLLDAIAKSNREVPWNKVPHLLTADGISDLVELYDLSLKKGEEFSPAEHLSVSKDLDKQEKTSLPTKKRKVREMNLQDKTATARILHDFLNVNFSCSECRHKVSQYATVCPNCSRKFVR